MLRDLDILRSMAERGLVKVALSVTTLDRKLARAMEPRGSTPDKRLAPTKRFFERPLAAVPVRAGMPDPIDDTGGGVPLPSHPPRRTSQDRAPRAPPAPTWSPSTSSTPISMA